MRAPRRFWDFCGWRWAPCVALVVAALAFVGLIVLVMPTQLDSASNWVDASAALARARAAERPSAPPEPTRIVVASAVPLSAAPELVRPSVAPVPPLASPSAGAVSAAAPDFRAQIADRGDRPHAPAARISGP